MTSRSRLDHILRHDVDAHAAIATRALLVVIGKCNDCLLDLRAEIRAVECGLVCDAPALLAIPAQAIEAALRPGLLDDDANCVGEADRVMRCVARQQEELALTDGHVARRGSHRIDHLEQHAALILVEKFSRLVDVIVSARVWAADHLDMSLATGVRGRAGAAATCHDSATVAVDAEVVDRRLEEVRIFLEPGVE